MKIAQIGALWYRIPPTKYGGTERILHYLTEGLTTHHDVTLFAAGTAKTSAHLHAIVPKPLAETGYPWTNIMYPLLNIVEAFEQADKYDILHMHLNKSSDYISLPLAKYIKQKVVFTLHFPFPSTQGRVDRERVLLKFKDLNYVSISNAARTGGEKLNWVGTVYNCVDTEKTYTFHPNPKNYLVWIGKFNPDKGTKEAILAAKKAGIPIKLAGAIEKLDEADWKYWSEEIQPLINNKDVQYVGEVDDKQKNELYGNALAFLNPIHWNEPFGLVMAESLAAGTPVISFRAGAAPELVADGETGYLVETVDQMVEKIKQVEKIDRKKCRERAESHFSIQNMVKGYETVYEKLV